MTWHKSSDSNLLWHTIRWGWPPDLDWQVRQAKGTGSQGMEKGRKLQRKGQYMQEKRLLLDRGGAWLVIKPASGVNQAIGIVGLWGVTSCFDHADHLLQVLCLIKNKSLEEVTVSSQRCQQLSSVTWLLMNPRKSMKIVNCRKMVLLRDLKKWNLFAVFTCLCLKKKKGCYGNCIMINVCFFPQSSIITFCVLLAWCG